MNPQPLPQHELGDALAHLFPKHFLLIENLIFSSLEEMSEDYKGGQWHGHHCPNTGVFFMVPGGDRYTLSVPGNGFQGEVKGETAGIVASLVGLNKLAWYSREPRHSELFHNLRHYAIEHPDGATIMRAID